MLNLTCYSFFFEKLPAMYLRALPYHGNNLHYTVAKFFCFSLSVGDPKYIFTFVLVKVSITALNTMTIKQVEVKGIIRLTLPY